MTNSTLNPRDFYSMLYPHLNHSPRTVPVTFPCRGRELLHICIDDSTYVRVTWYFSMSEYCFLFDLSIRLPIPHCLYGSLVTFLGYTMRWLGVNLQWKLVSILGLCSYVTASQSYIDSRCHYTWFSNKGIKCVSSAKKMAVLVNPTKSTELEWKHLITVI